MTKVDPRTFALIIIGSVAGLVALLAPLIYWRVRVFPRRQIRELTADLAGSRIILVTTRRDMRIAFERLVYSTGAELVVSTGSLSDVAESDRPTAIVSFLNPAQDPVAATEPFTRFHCPIFLVMTRNQADRLKAFGIRQGTTVFTYPFLAALVNQVRAYLRSQPRKPASVVEPASA